MNRPLAGIRVVDFTSVIAGPYCTRLLADCGAEVLKIEDAEGDILRARAPLRAGHSAYFGHLNAGKKSIVLDLKTEADRARLDRLLPHVDVLLEGFRPGVMEALGAGPRHALARNPGLVYCSLSGYGQEGPYRDHPGHDINYQALTGVCHMLRDAAEHPYGCALPLADLSSGLAAVATISAALYARQRDGRGRHIDVALIDTVLSWAYVWSEGLTPSGAKLSTTLPSVRRWLDTSRSPLLEPAARWLARPAGAATYERVATRLEHTAAFRNLLRLRLHALPHYALYQTADDRWISVGIVDERKFWTALCEGIGLPAPLRASLAAIPLAARVVTGRPVRRLIAQAFRRRTLADWLRTLDRARVPVAPVLPLDEALADPHLVTRILDPRGHAATPYPFADASLARSPRLGEHTEAIFAGLPAQ